MAADRSSDRSLDRLSDRSDKLTPPAASSAPAEDIQRWTAGRKAAVVLDLIRGHATAADVARQFNLTVAEVDSWVERFMEGSKEGLRAVPRGVEVARFAGGASGEGCGVSRLCWIGRGRWGGACRAIGLDRWLAR